MYEGEIVETYPTSVEEEEEDDIDEDEDGGGYCGGEDDEDDESGDNQVVPWSSTPLPPVATSSCSEEECTSRFGGGGASELKRTRDEADLDSDNDIGCRSSQRSYNTISTALTLRAPGDDEGTSLTLFRQLKQPWTTEVSHSVTLENDHEESKSNSMAILSSLKRFQLSTISGGDNVSAAILEIRKLSRDPRALQLDLH